MIENYLYMNKNRKWEGQIEKTGRTNAENWKNKYRQLEGTGNLTLPVKEVYTN